MKNYIINFKRYLNNPTDENFIMFFGAAINEYIELKTGRNDLTMSDVGIRNYKEMDKWIYNDWKFKEWFKNEFGYWIKYEGNDLVLTDLRWIGVKKSYKPLDIDLPPEARPRDVDDLIPEV